MRAEAKKNQGSLTRQGCLIAEYEKNRKKYLVWLIFIVFFILIFMPSFLFSNPQDGQVINGSVDIHSSDANTLQINQSTDKAIINWRSFNIDTQEKTQFIQPSSHSVTLNRISASQGVSTIYGKLSANGQIILINPAGVFLGPNAYISVASLVVSTANISNANFLSGNYIFDEPSIYSGNIINNGSIIAANHGLIALLGSHIENNGVIQANYGHVILATGASFIIDLSGGQLINFSIPEPLAKSSYITNRGAIIADAGTILISANSASHILDNAINMSGIIQANSVEEKNGEIILNAGNQGTVTVKGKVDASGKQDKEQGGHISILANNVVLLNDSVIDVSGNQGGGQILIGGDYQGKNSHMLNADNTFIDSHAMLFADALTNGNAGKVIVWSNKNTWFYGDIFARGGNASGNGGFVETSGKENLIFLGTVNTFARHGQVGTLLLDPANLYIINGAANSGDQDSHLISGTLPFTASDTANNTISVGALQSLGDINILLQAKNTLTVGNSVGQSTQLDLSSTLFSGTLTLQAGDLSTIGGGNVVFNSGSSITTGGGSIDIIAGDVTQNTGNAMLGAMSTQGGNIAVTAQQAVTANGLIDAGSGSISLTASNGLLSINHNINSLNNDITLIGLGITQGANTIINAGAGFLTLNAGNQTIVTNNGSQLLSTGSIALTADTMSLSALGLAQIGGDGSGSDVDFANAISLAPSSAATTVGIAGASGTLSLSSNSLATLHAFNVRIGDANTGTITLASWTPAINFAKAGVLTLDSANQILQTGSLDLSTNTANLLFRDANIINFNDSNNKVTNLAANIVGSLSFVNSPTHSLTITGLTDDIGTVNGLTAPGGISLTTSGIGGLLRINQNMTATNNIISLIGTGITQAGSTVINSGQGALTLNAGSNTITTGANSKMLSTGTITLIANAMLLNTIGSTQIGGDGSATPTDFASHLILREGTAGTTIGIAGGSGSVNLTAARLNTMKSFNVRIGDSSAGTIRLGAWTPSASFAKNGVIALSSANAISQTGTLNLTLDSASLLVRDASSVILTSNNIINQLAANINGALAVTNANAVPLTVTALTDDVTTTSGIYAPLGVNLTTSGTSGTLSINQNINTTNNAIVLTGTGVTQSANTIIDTGSAALTINANSNLTMQSQAKLLSTGAITLQANTILVDTTSQIGGNLAGTSLASYVVLFPGTSNTTIGIAGGVGSLSLPNNLLAAIQARHVRIGNNSAGNIDIGAWTSSANFAKNGVLTLDTSGTITQSGMIDLLTNSNAGLLLRNASNVALMDSLNNIDQVAAANIVNSLQVNSKHQLTVSTLTDDIGATNGINTLGNVILHAINSGVILNSPITANGSNNSIKLSGQSFINNAGSSALNPTAGYFLVWSGDPANDNRGDLTYQFKQYNALDGITAVAGSGNGFLYTIAPMITPSLTGIISKMYNGTTTATLAANNYTLSGNIDGDTVTLNNPTNGAYASQNAGHNINISVSGISVLSARDGSASVFGYQIVPTTNATIGTITPATLTYQANPINREYGLNNPALSGTVTGFVNGETQATATTGTLNFITSASQTSNVGNYEITGSGLVANFGNYVFTQAIANATALTISPAPLTITANNSSKIYGQTVIFNGTEFSSSGLRNNETINNVSLTSLGAAATANVSPGSPYSIDVSNAIGSGLFNPNNYNINYVSGALTILPATLTYNANLVTRAIGLANPPLTGTVTGFVVGDTLASATSGNVNFVTDATFDSPVGKYAINGNGLTANNGNYVFTQANTNATALTVANSFDIITPAEVVQATAIAVGENIIFPTNYTTPILPDSISSIPVIVNSTNANANANANANTISNINTVSSTNNVSNVETKNVAVSTIESQPEKSYYSQLQRSFLTSEFALSSRSGHNENNQINHSAANEAAIVETRDIYIRRKVSWVPVYV